MWWTKKKKFGWFTGGGYESDPFLTKEDKSYYREELKKERREPYSPKEPKEPRGKKDDWL